MIQWETLGELNAFRLLDTDPNVSAYHEQPVSIRFLLDGRTQIYCPDVLVETQGKLELWEILPSATAKEEQVVRRSRLLQAELPALGFAYRVVSTEQLSRQPQLANCLSILKYGRDSVDDAMRERIRRVFTSVPYVCWASALSGDFGSRGCSAFSRLTLEGMLRFDVAQPLSPATRFVWNEQGGKVSR
jgi:hypothetical protein